VLETVRAAANRGIADRLEKDETYRPSRRIARQLAVLSETEAVPRDFVATLQGLFQAEQDEAAQPRQPASKPDDGLQTTVQRTA
jgi:hypothetical protein